MVLDIGKIKPLNRISAIPHVAGQQGRTAADRSDEATYDIRLGGDEPLLIA
jgi:hypothetical protein